MGRRSSRRCASCDAGDAPFKTYVQAFPLCGSCREQFRGALGMELYIRRFRDSSMMGKLNTMRKHYGLSALHD